MLIWRTPLGGTARSRKEIMKNEEINKKHNVECRTKKSKVSKVRGLVKLVRLVVRLVIKIQRDQNTAVVAF